MWDDDPEDLEPDPVLYAQGRQADRTYASKSFVLNRSGSSDDGTPARFIYKVFDNEQEHRLERSGDEWLVRQTPAGRYQVKLLVARESGNVKELWIQRVPSLETQSTLETRLNLRGSEAQRLIDLVRLLPLIEPSDAESVRVNDDLIRDLFTTPSHLGSLYRSDPGQYRQMIVDDATARDVLALASRRRVRDEFRIMLDEPSFFDSLAKDVGGSSERVWQQFFERNPWILGVSLASQLLTSWDDERLEQIVSGFDISSPGKRTDALMRTVGRISSMVLVEFKTHRTPLLSPKYRSGCYPLSPAVVGGIAQIQGTVHQAVKSIGDRIQQRDDDGADIPDGMTYLIRPRSVLVVGELRQLQSATGGDHRSKIRSFELARRSLVEPEIVTFDELLARADFVVEAATVEEVDKDLDDDW